MEAEFKFDLDKPKDRQSFKMHVQAAGMYDSLREFDKWLRNEAKHHNNEKAAEIRTKMWEYLENVSLEIFP